MPLLDGTLASGVVARPFTGALAADPGAGRPALPQNIGHRGYKAAFPENSMAGFHGAVAAGAHAVETDLHLSRDGVVVLSHDATLKRCFGVDQKIADCDWDYLSTLQTLREPRQGMPRLVDVLEWLNQRGNEEIWVLLDIKPDDDPHVFLPAIAATIDSVPPLPSRPWNTRLILGAWNSTYIHLLTTHLPAFPLAIIASSPLLAHKYLSPSYPTVSFNMFQPSLVGLLGARFRRAVHAAEPKRSLFAWTVNDEHWMEWCVRKGVDGVITDEVGRFREVCERFTEEEEAQKGAVVVRKRAGLGRKVRLYAVAWLLQVAGAVIGGALLWMRGRQRKQREKGKGVVKVL